MPEQNLLHSISCQKQADYYTELLKATGLTKVAVRQTNDGRGKGIFAQQDIQEGEAIFKDSPIAAIQQSGSKQEWLNCSRCCQFLGSLDLQTAWKLRSSGRLSAEVILRLQSGEARLPLSDQYPLPSPVACRGRCDDLYCSEACAERDWQEHHQLLCIGEASPNCEDAEKYEGLCQFWHHAEETNDIFLLAAKVFAVTLLRARERVAAYQESSSEALKTAWQPFAVGWKRPWWECVALPADVSDETAFRQGLRDLASESLALLRRAIYDPSFDALFKLDVYGSLVGMFELNNLGFSITSQLGDWLQEVRRELKQPGVTHDQLLPLGVICELLEESLEEDDSCLGTGFYPFQSCINHSCLPNASIHCAKSNECTIVAQMKISKGEEITVSYIDEDMSFQERHRALLDYGFECKCPRCVQDSHKKA